MGKRTLMAPSFLVLFSLKLTKNDKFQPFSDVSGPKTPVKLPDFQVILASAKKFWLPSAKEWPKLYIFFRRKPPKVGQMGPKITSFGPTSRLWKLFWAYWTILREYRHFR